MNKKGLVIAGVAGLAVALFAGSASADDDDVLPPPPDPDPDDDSDPLPDDESDYKKTPPDGKHPPNTSGDKAGYNTEMFPGAQAVRQWLINLGYSVTLDNVALVKNRKVKDFQRDYNTVSAAIQQNMGTLLVDGTAGKNTLNAIEIAWSLAMNVYKMSWKNLVKEAKKGNVG